MSETRAGTGVSMVMSVAVTAMVGLVVAASHNLPLSLVSIAMGLLAVSLLEWYRRPALRPDDYREFRIPPRPEVIWHLGTPEAQQAVRPSARRA